MGGRRSLARRGALDGIVSAAVRAAVFDIVLLARTSAEVAIRVLLFLAHFLLEIIGG